MKEFQKNFDVIAPLSFGYDNVAGNLNELTNKIKKHYFGSEAITNNSRSKAIQVRNVKCTIASGLICIFADVHGSIVYDSC